MRPARLSAVCALADRGLLTAIAADYGRHAQRRFAIWGTGPDYLRGAIALTLDRLDEAKRWFTTGLEWATQWDIEIRIARNRYELAAVAERRGDHALATEQLDDAGALFAKRGAKLYLDQVIAKKQVLRALGAPARVPRCARNRGGEHNRDIDR